MAKLTEAGIIRRVALILVLSWVDANAAQAQPPIEIALERGSPAEAETKAQLQRLLKEYDLSPWIFTRSIRIDERSIPHSHPVLTLHARHVKDDELLVSTFVHEQLHWFLSERNDRTQLAIAELRQMFPTVPGPDEGGAGDEQSTYLHLLVCQLERQAVLRLMGELKTRQVMDFWAGDHYQWIYRTVVDRSRDIGAVLRKHNLVPPR
jgi:hypothetical protein